MEEALESAEWDVIVADYAMPHFSLDEALAMVRGKKDSILPLLIVSATIFEEDAIQAMREGARDFIMKDKLGRLAPAVERELREASPATRAHGAWKSMCAKTRRWKVWACWPEEWRTILTIYLSESWATRAWRSICYPPSSPLVPLLDDVVMASQKAAELTRQMLAYAGKGGFVSEPTNLSALVRDMSDLVRTSISKRVRIDLRLDRGLAIRSKGTRRRSSRWS